MSRSLSVLSALSLFLALSSCEPAGGDPEIIDLKIKPDRAINRGDTLEISANANFDTDFATAAYKIMGPRGDASSYFHATSNFPRRLETSGGLSFRIVVDSVRPAFYDLTLTLTDAESYSNSKTVRFAIDYPPVALRLVDSLVLEAGSYLESVSSPTPAVWTGSAATSRSASLDALLDVDKEGRLCLMSPDTAHELGLGVLLGVNNRTLFIDLGTRPPQEWRNLDSIPESSMTRKVEVQEGRTYLARTVAKENALLRARRVTGTGKSASVQFEFYDDCCATGLLATP